MKKIKVIFFTGNRSEFGLLVPIIKKISECEKTEYKLIVSGTHLSDKFGSSISEIEKERISIHYKIPIQTNGASDAEVVIVFSKIFQEFGEILEIEKPNYVFVLGDRYETLAAAQAAFFYKIPILHSGGGNITQGGCLDDINRHLITKMASLHFVSCKENYNNIVKLGEEPWRIFITGSTAVETVLNEKLLTKDELSKEFNLSFDMPLILFTQHPVASNWQEAGHQVKKSLIALNELGYQTIITYPNADAGGSLIIEEYDKWKETKSFQFIKNLGRIKYLSLMKYCNVVVGNSSSGLLETPIFKVPSVNIGNRQKGRVRSTNVIDVDYDTVKIKEAIKNCLFDEEFIMKAKHCENPFGDGNSSKKIRDIILEYYGNERLLKKY